MGGTFRHSARATGGAGGAAAGVSFLLHHIPASPSLAHPGVDPGDLGDVGQPVGVFEVEDVVEGPVQVVGDVRDFLVQPVGRVRHDSPRRPPATSTTKLWPHSGQATPALVWPSLLTRRYMSCRNARSDANRFSMIPECTSVMSPIRVTTRASSTTVRNAEFSRTLSSRSGISSSRAVARRITPEWCTLPSSLTYPRGSSNANSVRSFGRSARGSPAAAGDSST